MIFIDGANIKKAASTAGIKIDYIKLINVLTNGRDNRRSYFFDAIPKTTSFNPKIGFLDALRRNGVTVKTKDLRTRLIKCDKCIVGKRAKELNPFLKLPDSQLPEINQDYQKGVDIALVTEFFRMAREDGFDTAVIISGDDDFASAVDCVKSMSKRVEVASFRKSLGSELKEVADRLIILDDIIDSIKRLYPPHRNLFKGIGKLS